MKRKSPTPWLPFSSRLLLRPLPDISLATWDLDPFSHHHCVKDRYMLPMEIYTYLSYRRKINETDVSYTYNWQKVWDRQLWLAEWKWLLTINLYAIYNSIDQRRFLNTMECDHCGKGQGKRTILRYFIFSCIEVFLKKFGRNHLQAQLRRDCM